MCIIIEHEAENSVPIHAQKKKKKTKCQSLFFPSSFILPDVKSTDAPHASTRRTCLKGLQWQRSNGKKKKRQ